MSYQWRFNGVNISGATLATYSIASVNATHAGSYSCAVSNAVGTVVSDPVALTVGPAITVQPASLSVNPWAAPGYVATLSVTATGSAPLYYQWRRNGVDIEGATGATCTLFPVTEAIEGIYTVRVSNVLGGITSNPALLSVNDPVVITAQPAPLGVNPGAPAVFTVGVSGTGPFTYQWMKGSSVIAGATGAKYSIAAVAESDEGTYSVVVTNVVGAVQSSGALLMVNNPVQIFAQPEGRSVNPGASTTFRLTVHGTEPINYQWRRGGVVIPGATGVSYTLDGVAKCDEGNYDVVASNMVGSVVSMAARLSVTNAVAIVSQPQSRGVVPGESVVFTVAATGTSPLTYQWSKDGVAIAGARGASFALLLPGSGDVGVYTVAVSNVAGTVVSDAARLTLNDFGVTTQPVACSAMPGGSVSFSVSASGTTGTSYQWQRNATALPGAVSATLTLARVSVADAGEYSCVLTAAQSVAVSNGALLTVGPVITGQPAGASAVGGSGLTLSVTAQGSEPLSYQWRLGGVNIPSATGASYAMRTAQSADAGTYDVVVTNAAGSVTSAPAVVGVSPRLAPFSEWILSWPGITDFRPEGDPDGDGVSNLMEYFAGSSPVASGVEGRPLLRVDSGVARFIYRRSKSVTGLSAVVEFAGGYPSPLWDSAGVTEAVVDRGIYEEVTARIPLSNGDRRMLVRLRVSQ